VDAEPREQRVILLLADISGYTRFMVENQLSAVHGQMVISHLLESLLREVDLPLELQEIEGDAIFLIATRPDGGEWESVVKDVQIKLLRFFEVFIEAAAGLGEMTACQCAICTHADDLKLKIVVHTGRAVFHSLGGRRQVSGTDVILAHRLLKNSVPGNEYLLLSDDAYREFGLGMEMRFEPGEETYEGLGTVQTWVHHLGDRLEGARDAFYSLDAEQEQQAIRAYIRFGERAHFPALWKELREPTTNAGFLRRALFTLGLALYLPLFMLRYPAVVRRHVAERRAARGSPSP
jgi:class 3 adenylate cyclase